MRAIPAGVLDAALELTVAGSFTTIGYRARKAMFGWQDPAADLAGRTYLVTGATSGLGRATAARLAGGGASVIVLGRDPGRTKDAADAVGGHAVVADLADLSAVRRAALQVREHTGRLDALINNAGALTHEFVETTDGLELTYQTHVVAPFLLVHELLDLLRATAGSRVVTVSSGGMYTTALDVAGLQMAPDRYDGVAAYARAKRAQVVLNQEWAKRVPAPPVFHAMHPGWADTPGVVDSLPTFHRVVGPFLRSPEQGADTSVWLAAAQQPLASSGQFWLDRRPRGTNYLPRTGSPAGEADRLWQQVSRDAGVG
jgi:NAD(P)-dependent dehydrogenase (short-subunit alcohol dehydrogenase family)